MIRQKEETTKKEEGTKGAEQKKLSDVKSDMHEIFNDIGAAWKNISELFFGRQKSIDEFAQGYEEACDSIITNAVRGENLKYIAGKINFTKVGDYCFECACELYFKTQQDKWIVKKASSGRLDMIKNLLPDAVIELKEKGKIMFEVEEPKG